MSINGQAHAEALTRDAAKAINLHVPDTARWDTLLGGLRLYPATPYEKGTFAPLNDPADAYRVEVALKINIAHHAVNNNFYVMCLRSSEAADGAGIIKAVRPDEADDAMRLRMEAVTMFASLTTMMQDA